MFPFLFENDFLILRCQTIKTGGNRVNSASKIMTKQEKKILNDLAIAMTRCQVLKGASTRHYAIVNGTHALWSILNGNYETSAKDIEELNKLFVGIK